MDSPWTAIARAEEGREYLALLSYLPLRTYFGIPEFFRYAFGIQRQIREAPGALGYALRAKILSRKFWTLSVWEDDRALLDFVRKAPHEEAMKKIARHIGATKFTRWKLAGSAIPPSWNDAMQREAGAR